MPVGTYAITVVASDGNFTPMTGSQTFTVNVLYGGPPPALVSTSLSTRRGLTITLNFSQVLAAGPADNPGNYELVVPPKTRRGHSRLIALTPDFVPGTTTVTLTTRTRLTFSPALQLTIVGAAPGGLTNLYGSFLDENSSAPTGSNFLALVTKKGLTPVASFPVASARIQARAKTAKAMSHVVHHPAGPRVRVRAIRPVAKHGLA